MKKPSYPLNHTEQLTKLGHTDQEGKWTDLGYVSMTLLSVGTPEEKP